MERMTIPAAARIAGNKGHARRLRAAEMIPAVIYGKTTTPVAVAVAPRELKPALVTEFGFNNVFMLAIEGGETFQVMIKERQFDPVRRELTHLDFYVVEDDQIVEIDVPVKAVGESVGVKAGGLLQVVSRSVKLACGVKNLPSVVEHDITEMHVTDSAYIDEMTAPEGAKFVFKNRYPVIRIARKRGAKLRTEGEEE